MRKVIYVILAFFTLLCIVPNINNECYASFNPTKDLVIYNNEEIWKVDEDFYKQAVFVSSNSYDNCCDDCGYRIASVNSNTEIPFFDKIFGKKKKDDKTTKQTFKEYKKVYVGGIPLGFTIFSRGVVIVGISEVETTNGKVKSVIDENIKPGDILLSLNGFEINGANSIARFLSSCNKGDILDAKIKRGAFEFIARIAPQIDSFTGELKLGLWIRDNSAGVGTLTYVCENGDFGALGHAVCDLDTGTIIPIYSGNIYKCNVVGVQKSRAGNPGELRGLFLKNGTPIGELNKNTDSGVFGKVDNVDKFSNLGELLEIAEEGDIKMGPAKIRTTIDGTKPIEVDIEIIKTSYINQNKQNSFVIRITDEKLLSQTGGIVQGMSGSPIIQNGKLIGAVTHVFVNDASKGFGIFIGEMLKQSQ